jgi:NADH dehydrogenase subunit K (EC 1.6.5.3)
MVSLSDYLILSAIIFCIGLVGIFVNRTNIITLLMCVELILVAVNTNFIAFSHFLGNEAGQIFCLLYFNGGSGRGCDWTSYSNATI